MSVPLEILESTGVSDGSGDGWDLVASGQVVVDAMNNCTPGGFTRAFAGSNCDIGFVDAGPMAPGVFDVIPLPTQDLSLIHILTDWGEGAVSDASTAVVEVGRDAYCHWLPALLGGRLIRHHDELVVAGQGGDMAFRGLFFSQADEHLDVFAVDLHETGPSGGDVHWRGAATGSSQASFEGLIQINPGAQQTHTYLQLHSMMLSLSLIHI